MQDEHINILVYADTDTFPSIEDCLKTEFIKFNLFAPSDTSEFINQININNIDIAISDDSILLQENINNKILNKMKYNTPIIIISNGCNIKNINKFNMIRFVDKNELWRLPSIIRLNLGSSCMISDKDKLEQRLYAVESKYQSIFYNNKAVMLLIDPLKFQINDANSAAEKFYGYTLDELQGMSLYTICTATKEKIEQFINNPNENGFHIETKHRLSNESYKDVECYITPLRVEDKTFLHVLVHDMTERKLMEKELLDAKKTAEMANSAKNEFLTRISHEIRTPLNGVIGLTGLLMMTKLDDVQQSYSVNLKYAADTLLKIINNVLDFSQIESGKIDVENINFKLHEIFKQVINIFSHKLYEKGIQVFVEDDYNIPDELIGDFNKIKQIMINLLSNAIKFSNNKDIIIGCKSLVKERKNDFNTILVEFYVQDFGSGIPKDQLINIFDRFSQIDISKNHKERGSGLGLSLSKKLVSIMNGEIFAESELDKGSTFKFQIPLTFNTYEYEQVSWSFKFKNVHVLDSNINNHNIYKSIFNRIGLSVDFSSNEIDFLYRIKSSVDLGKNYELIFIDYDLPYANGLQLSSMIREELHHKKKFYIILSCSNIKRAELLGEKDKHKVDYIISKPIMYVEIIDILKNLEKEKRDNEEKQLTEIKQNLTYNNTVLIAEDDSVNMIVISNLMKKLGFNVIKAYNGVEALEIFKKNDIGLVITDIHMPKMNGYELSLSIRKIENKDKKPVILALTAETLKGTPYKCIEFGMDGYIPKPFTLEDLTSVLNNIKIKYNTDKSEQAPENVNDITAEQSQFLYVNDDSNIFEKNFLLKKVGSNLSTYIELISLFIKQTPMKLENLEKSVENQETSEALFTAHSLKGTCSTLGAPKMSKAAAEMEISLRKSNNINILRTNLNKLILAFEELKPHLDKVRTEYRNISS